MQMISVQKSTESTRVRRITSSEKWLERVSLKDTCKISKMS